MPDFVAALERVLHTNEQSHGASRRAVCRDAQLVPLVRATRPPQAATAEPPQRVDCESERASTAALLAGRSADRQQGSWLQVAECELSCLTRPCLQGRRLGTLDVLRTETAAGATSVNARQRAVHWHLTVADARAKLKSVDPKIIV